MPTLGVGMLLVVLDVRVPTPVGALDVLPDALGWVLVLVVARRQGWRRAVPALAAVAAVSLLELFAVDAPRWLAVSQVYSPVVAVLGFVLVALGAQTWAREQDLLHVADRFDRHRARLSYVLVPALITAFLVTVDLAPGPFTAVGSLLDLAGRLLVLWFAVDLLRPGSRGSRGGTESHA